MQLRAALSTLLLTIGVAGAILYFSEQPTTAELALGFSVRTT